MIDTVIRRSALVKMAMAGDGASMLGDILSKLGPLNDDVVKSFGEQLDLIKETTGRAPTSKDIARIISNKFQDITSATTNTVNATVKPVAARQSLLGLMTKSKAPILGTAGVLGTLGIYGLTRRQQNDTILNRLSNKVKNLKNRMIG